ncbi:hypothetical protein IAE22_32245 [Bacillus sp. S34]|nr:hypothetical protein [Bacillus sp. S34]
MVSTASTAAVPLTAFSIAEADRDLDPATFLATSPTWYPASSVRVPGSNGVRTPVRGAGSGVEGV